MPLSPIQTVFSGNPLNRADQMRLNAEILGDIARGDDARFAVMAGDMMLSDEAGDIAWLTPGKIRFLPVANRIFLGLDGTAPRYAAKLAGEVEEFDGMFDHNQFRDLRAIAGKLGVGHRSLGIIAQAKSMLSWHESHRFCAKCGSESVMVKAGYERKCPACEASHFPRTDPVVIMLAFYGNKALVGRGYHLPAGMYSALAGFMEPGETIEEAVARELYEEAGVKATRVDYVTSQPWPWPSSLMIGCMAWVEDDTLTIDHGEIETAIWITKDQAREGMKRTNPDFMLPPPFAIACNLMEAWLREG